MFLDGAPGEIRTPDRSVRSRLLYPAELRVRSFDCYCNVQSGGEKGIRTLDTTFRSYAPLAGEYLQPLGHLSATVCAHYGGFALACQACVHKNHG